MKNEQLKNSGSDMPPVLRPYQLEQDVVLTEHVVQRIPKAPRTLTRNVRRELKNRAIGRIQ